MSTEMNTLVVVAQMMPEHILISKVEEAIALYKEAQILKYPVEVIQDRQMDMGFYCLLLEIRITGNNKDPFAMTKEMDKIAKVYEMLNPNQQ